MYVSCREYLYLKMFEWYCCDGTFCGPPLQFKFDFPKPIHASYADFGKL